MEEFDKLSKMELYSEDDFIYLWIGTTYEDIIYLSGKEIKDLGELFNISLEKLINKNPDPYRKDIFKFLLRYCLNNNISEYKIFSLLLSKRKLFKRLNLETIDSNSLKVYSDTINRFIEELNLILRLYNATAVYDLNTEEFNIIKANNLKTILENTLVNLSTINDLITNANSSLKNKDYQSVLTKSRSIIETTFKYILQERNISFDKNDSLSKLRGKVNKILNINPSSKSWKNLKDGDDKKEIQKLVSSLNNIIDIINTVRNKKSDAHGRLKKFILRKGEAEFILNSAITLSSYYMSIYNRSK